MVITSSPEHCNHIPTKNGANEIVCRACGFVLNEDRISFRLRENVHFTEKEEALLPYPIFLNVFKDDNRLKVVTRAMGRFKYLCQMLEVSQNLTRHSLHLYRKIILSINSYEKHTHNFDLCLMVFSLIQVKRTFHTPISLRVIFKLISDNYWGLSLSNYQKIIGESIPNKFKKVYTKAEEYLPILINEIFDDEKEPVRLSIYKKCIEMLKNIRRVERGGRRPRILATATIYVATRTMFDRQFCRKYSQVFIEKITGIPTVTIRGLARFIGQRLEEKKRVGELNMGRLPTPEGWICANCEKPGKIHGKIGDTPVCKKCYDQNKQANYKQPSLNNGFEVIIKDIRGLHKKMAELFNSDMSNMRIKDYSTLMVELRELSSIGEQIKDKIISEIQKL